MNTRTAVAVISAVVGGLVAFLIQRFLNKRGSFTYFVRHTSVGVSADDAIFGTVRLTWNDNPIAHLYASTVELRNESLTDYENVVVKVFSNDTEFRDQQRSLLKRLIDKAEGVQQGVA